MIKYNNFIYPHYDTNGVFLTLACNIYKFCTHGCLYCFAPKVTFTKPEIFFSCANPKLNWIEGLKKFLDEHRHEINSEIMLSFISDPYQPEEMKLMLTRRTLEIFREFDLSFTVLTKAGMSAARDFDLFEGYSNARFGSTITTLNQNTANIWEPHAASISSRIAAIELAKLVNIPTWVSLEPVIVPREALQVIKDLHDIVDYWKVGKINRNAQVTAQKLDWITFREEAIALLKDLKANYTILSSLTNLIKK